MKIKLSKLLTLVSLPLAAGVLWWWVRPPPPPPPAPPRLSQLPLADQQQIIRAVELLALASTVRQERTRQLDPLQLQLAWTARRQLLRPDRLFRDDCSGFVSAVYTEVGVPMDGVVAQIWDLAVEYDALHWDERPQVGDLVFFDNTWDRNGNSLLDDELTHVGLVLDVEPDGTVLYAQAGVQSGRNTARLNLTAPDTHEDNFGVTLNSYLRAPEPGDNPGTPYLTGELFRAFATVDPDREWSQNLPWIPLD